MKKVIAAIALSLLVVSGSAFACGGGGEPECTETTVTQSGWAKSGNAQGQIQGFEGDASGNTSFGYGGSLQGQAGFGATSATKGNKASDQQKQEQYTFGETGDPAKNYLWGESYGSQEGGGEAKGSESEGGNYTYTGIQGQGGLGGTWSDGAGKAGFGGSAYLGIGKSTADAGANSQASQKQNQAFASGYYNLNEGARGWTETYGNNSAETSNQVSAKNGGSASSGVIVGQAGGSLALNNGDGTAMAGGSFSAGAGSAWATKDNCDGPASAKASYTATQTHGYTQYAESADGNSWQGASGQTSTTVKGNVVNK